MNIHLATTMPWFTSGVPRVPAASRLPPNQFLLQNRSSTCSLSLSPSPSLSCSECVRPITRPKNEKNLPRYENWFEKENEGERERWMELVPFPTLRYLRGSGQPECASRVHSDLVILIVRPMARSRLFR